MNSHQLKFADGKPVLARSNDKSQFLLSIRGGVPAATAEPVCRTAGFVPAIATISETDSSNEEGLAAM
jgi:hypothetical protein